MRLLALDTATACCSIAVLEDERLLAKSSRAVTTHAQGLLEQLDAVLAEARLRLGDLDALVCGQGPGSFTGLRIGLATLKGLCFAARKPLLCVPTMTALGAAAARELGAEALVAAIVDARRQELYCGLYRGGEAIGPALLSTPRGLATYLALGEPVTLVGDGALAYAELLCRALPAARLGPNELHEVDATYLGRAALPRARAGDFDDLAAVGPLYLRPADARLPSAAK